MYYAYLIALNLLLNILFYIPAVHATGPLPPRYPQTLKVEASKSLHIPSWVTDILEHGFVGISKPCRAIEEARQQAFNSVVSQILQTMGAEYRLTHKSILSGNASYSHYDLNERLTYTSRWFIRSIQQNIKKSDIQQVQDKYICFVLIDFPPAKIQQLRKLTIGPKVAARIVRKQGDRLIIEIRENNGVRVTLIDYYIMITTKNCHAGIITMFAWKVSESSSHNFEGVIQHKVSVKGNSQKLSIPKPIFGTSFKHRILGSQNQTRILLRGYDEIGRQVEVIVTTP
jgi:hypothetical protein